MRPPMPQPPLRIAVVVQRFAPAIVGGAEAHARAFVQALQPWFDVTVLTSCAIDAGTWAMHFEPGVEHADGVTVKRFAHPPRNAGGRAKVPLAHKLRFLLRRPAAPIVGDDVTDGHEFLRRQGPACAGLVDELRGGGYDAAVFFTALYFPTAEGLPAWGPRSVLIPTLHDEKPMWLPWFRRVFAAAGVVLWNTAAEQRLARRLYGADAPEGEVVGAAVQVGAPGAAQIEDVRQRYRLPPRYLVYVGRIEKGKGCAELLAAWNGIECGGAALVFVGKGSLPIAEGPTVRVTGFVPEADRDALVAGAAALVMPSRYESLSLVLLEALALGVPVLVNAGCEPLADHARASGAGELYRGRAALRAGLARALTRPDAERERLGELGRRYVQRHYTPEHVAARWRAAVDAAASLPSLR